MKIELKTPQEVDLQSLGAIRGDIIDRIQPETDRIQVCTLGDHRIVAAGVYRQILDGDATLLVGLRVSLRYYTAGLGSIMLRTFAEESGLPEAILAAKGNDSEMPQLFERAFAGRVYPNYTSIFLRREYTHLESIAARIAADPNMADLADKESVIVGKHKPSRLFVTIPFNDI